MRHSLLAALMLTGLPGAPLEVKPKTCKHCRALPDEPHGQLCPEAGWHCVPIDRLPDPEPFGSQQKTVDTGMADGIAPEAQGATDPSADRSEP